MLFTKYFEMYNPNPVPYGFNEFKLNVSNFATQAAAAALCKHFSRELLFCAHRGGLSQVQQRVWMVLNAQWPESDCAKSHGVKSHAVVFQVQFSSASQ